MTAGTLIEKLKAIDISPLTRKKRRWVPLADVLAIVRAHETDQPKASAEVVTGTVLRTIRYWANAAATATNRADMRLFSENARNHLDNAIVALGDGNATLAPVAVETGCIHSVDSNNKCMVCRDPRLAALVKPESLRAVDDDTHRFVEQLDAGLRFIGADVQYPPHNPGQVRISLGMRHTQLRLPAAIISKEDKPND